MKTKYRDWVRFEDIFDTGEWTAVDRVYDNTLGVIVIRKGTWELRARKILASMEQKFRDDIAHFLDQLNQQSKAAKENAGCP